MLTTKSPLTSKINITQAVGLVAGILVYFDVVVPEEVQTQVILGIGAVTQVATWVLRTWFTTEMTPQSASRAGLL